MFTRPALVFLVTAVLALFATAHPNLQPRYAGGVKTIPLRRRTGLTRADGVFDYRSVVNSIVATRNKHRQNMINLERNRGRRVFPEDAETKPATAVTETSFSPDYNGHRLSTRQSGSEALTDQEQDTEWTGIAFVGTPPQQFIVDFDTGSSDLWIPSIECKTSSCANKRLYNSSWSSTSKNQPGQFSIRYGDGSNVNGTVFTDTVTVAGIKAEGQFLAGATSISDLFTTDPTDGILGLGFPAISQLRHNPFFLTASEQGTVSPSSFAFYLSSNNSELHLGGPNSGLFTGSIEAHGLSVDRGFWQIGNAHINLNGQQAVLNGLETIIDTGTSIIVAPPDEAASFYGQVPGSSLFDKTNGLYEFPCNSVPEVSFGWGGREWIVTADNFNLGQTDTGSSMCVGAISGQDLGLGSNVWLLGDSFLKNVYTVFDTNAKTVGFAQLSVGHSV
ncbi:hypothetical protein AX15_004875 [Amanita polypyramis BW_CC]|nr:hypothetical protein AX15_004875 [Amanita polypyramis BW_CC]